MKRQRIMAVGRFFDVEKKGQYLDEIKVGRGEEKRKLGWSVLTATGMNPVAPKLPYIFESKRPPPVYARFDLWYITLEVKNDVLRLAGERKVLHNDEVSVHRQERRNFSFDRTLKLPFNVDESQIKADFKDGLLAVELVHSEQDKPQKIAIH